MLFPEAEGALRIMLPLEVSRDLYGPFDVPFFSKPCEPSVTVEISG